MALNRVSYGEPTDPAANPPTAYAIAYQTTPNGDERPDPVILDLTVLDSEWTDENTHAHTIYAAGDEHGELEDYMERVDLEGETEELAEKTTLTAREAQAYALTEHYHAQRIDAAKILGIEPSTLDTLKARAEEEIEKARTTIEWAQRPI